MWGRVTLARLSREGGRSVGTSTRARAASSLDGLPGLVAIGSGASAGAGGGGFLHGTTGSGGGWLLGVLVRAFLACVRGIIGTHGGELNRTP